MEPILLVSFVISFFVTLGVMPHWIIRAKKAGLVGKDMHKLEKKDIAEMGGIIVVFGFLLGVLFYVGVRTFYFGDSKNIVNVFAILSTVLIIMIIGVIDDVLGWKIGLRQWQKPLLTLFAALPIMAVNAGNSIMQFPYIGAIEFGIIYPLIIIPIIIVGASNGFNMIAGYNGLEAGMGIIIISALSYAAWVRDYAWLAVVGLCMVFALVAFWFFNRKPAKVFPGDSMTYSVGAIIGCMAIMGNMDCVGLVLFLPYFIELFLKLRGRFKKESFAKLDPDGGLVKPYDKIYGIEHLAIVIWSKLKKKVSENNVVYMILAGEFILLVLVVVVLTWRLY